MIEHIRQPGGCNRILMALSEADAIRLDTDLEPVELKAQQVLHVLGDTITHVYFPGSCVASVITENVSGVRLEASMVGREGFTGIGLVLGDPEAAQQTIVQTPGRALRIEAGALREAMGTSSSLRTLLLRTVQTLIIQMAHTALANGKATLEERLARWLLMCQDHTGGTQLRVTHQYLSNTLGVRRAGVTVALHILEGKGLVRSSRGICRILDREGLSVVANGYYGAPEAAYERLMGERTAS